jgi:tetratricopeptide (TPR) repeat protein
MECRRVALRKVRVQWLLPAGLVFGLCFGCVPSATVPTTPVTPAPSASVKEDKDLPKKVPQVSTVIALGDLHLNTAFEPKCPPAQRERALEQARKCYQEALRLDGNCQAAYHGLARVYAEIKEHDRAIATYEKALKNWPADASFRFELGMYQARHQNWTPALEALKKACDLDSENRAYATTYAFGLARAGRADESLDVFRKLGSEAQAHYNLARMLHHMQQDDQCRAHLEKALEADPQLASARQMLTALKNPNALPVKADVSVGFESMEDQPASQN